MITQIIYEIELKLTFLEKRKKIDPKSLVEDVHHFTDLLANFVVKCKGFEKDRYNDYSCEEYYDDDNYYDQYAPQENQDSKKEWIWLIGVVCVTNLKISKSKSKKKAKKGKKLGEGDGNNQNDAGQNEIKAFC